MCPYKQKFIGVSEFQDIVSFGNLKRKCSECGFVSKKFLEGIYLLFCLGHHIGSLAV